MRSVIETSVESMTVFANSQARLKDFGQKKVRRKTEWSTERLSDRCILTERPRHISGGRRVDEMLSGQREKVCLKGSTR